MVVEIPVESLLWLVSTPPSQGIYSHSREGQNHSKFNCLLAYTTTLIVSKSVPEAFPNVFVGQSLISCWHGAQDRWGPLSTLWQLQLLILQSFWLRFKPVCIHVTERWIFASRTVRKTRSEILFQISKETISCVKICLGLPYVYISKADNNSGL